MTMIRPFNPAYGSNQLATLAAGVEQHFRIDKSCETLRVVNSGATNPLYFKTYNSGTTSGTPPAPNALTPPQALASTADCRVGPGATQLVGTCYYHDAISIISAAGTTVEFMTGTAGIV